MPETTMIGFRIPNDLLEKIDALKTDEKTRTDVIVELLESALGIDSRGDDYQSLIERLAEVEQTLNERIAAVEQTVEQLKSDRIAVPQVSAKQVKSDRIAVDPSPAKQVKSDRLTGEPSPPCPHCQSDATRWEGFGKLRADGTRSRRIKCRACGRVTVVA